MRHIESNIQMLCVKWFSITHPKLRYLLVLVSVKLQQIANL